MKKTYEVPATKFILERLEIPKGTLNMVLDTDTYNEIDDQFALVHALTSPDRLNVQAVYAAPFSNDRAATPGEGMEKSYDEIQRVLERLRLPAKPVVLKGAGRYLGSTETPVDCPAVQDLIRRAKASTEPLYVVAIGAITNIASAILLEPSIVSKIVVVWLGGHAHYWPDTKEFNLMQDVPAAQVVFDSGVPVLQVPCLPVASHLTTSVQELDHHIRGKSAIGDYLAGIFREYQEKRKRMAKEIWDVAAIAVLLNPEWTPADLVHSPVVGERLVYSRDDRRHLIKCVRWIHRDAVFADLFAKIARG
jgi:purine nucleosidase